MESFLFSKNDQASNINRGSLLPKKAELHPQKTATANTILTSCALIVFFIFKNHIQKDSLLPKKAVLHPQKTAAANKILMSCAQTVFFIFKK